MDKSAYQAFTQRPKRGFTLVELLVVIAIIGILATLILPVLASAKQKSFQTQCLSNQHQIGLAMLMYAAEAKGLFPESGGLILWNQIDPITQQHGWMQQIAAYAPNTNAFHCPCDLHGCFSYFNGVRAAYVVVTNYAAVDTKLIEYPAAQVLSGDTVWTGEGLEDADKDDYTQNCVGGATNGTPAVGWQVHNKGQNILFTDGHAKWYRGYITNEMTFRFNSMHGWQ
jgi:prepilin-type N-terminal cleavage/methylation domain-containing protein/prepilin-type processing-associated H-X9-DG protein